MKKLTLFLSILINTLPFKTSFSQVIEIHPVLSWISEYYVPETGAGFMDYTDDWCQLSFVPDMDSDQSGMVSLNSDGSNNYTADGWNFPGIQVGGLFNNGTNTTVAAANKDLGTVEIRILDNDSETILGSYSTPIPTGYEMIEMVDMEFSALPWATFPSSVVAISTVLNTTTNKKEVLTSRIGINPLGYSFGATQTGSIIIESRNSIPVSVVIDNLNNVYVWGTVDRNAAGTTHDCFLLKLNPDLVVQYSKLHSSYTGRDDIATGLAIDAAGNLFGISNSQNNTAPYYDHGAVFKLNKSNGKRLLLKRIGMNDLGDTGTHEVRADYCGNGIAITGNTANATNHDSRTWRIDAAGNILWTRAINLETLPESFETGSNLTFCEVTCDVIVTGFRKCAYPMCGGVYIIRYDAETGATVWGPETYSEPEYEFSETSQLQINYGTVDNSVYFSGSCISLLSGLWEYRVMKYDQVVLKSELPENNSLDLQITPNPAQNSININNMSNGMLGEIVDINGKSVLTFITSENNKLDVSKLIPGMYFVKVVSENATPLSVSFIKM